MAHRDRCDSRERRLAPVHLYGTRSARRNADLILTRDRIWKKMTDEGRGLRDRMGCKPGKHQDARTRLSVLVHHASETPGDRPYIASAHAAVAVRVPPNHHPDSLQQRHLSSINAIQIFPELREKVIRQCCYIDNPDIGGFERARTRDNRLDDYRRSPGCGRVDELAVDLFEERDVVERDASAGEVLGDEAVQRVVVT